MAAENPEAVLQRLDWTVIRRLDGILQGDYRTLYRGFGMELADLREYQFGDDIRYIDWNVTARMNTPFVRQYIEDREVTAWFLLDLSPSIDFGTVQKLKRHLLIDFVGVLARLLTRHGNPVGAILYYDNLAEVIPPQSGKRQALLLISQLLGPKGSGKSQLTDLTPMLETGARAFRRRSLVFVISDFISTPGWDKPLKALGRRHEVLGVRLFDPRERELPDIGPIVLEDAETGEQLHLDTHDKRFRKRFAETTEAREQQLAASFARAGVDALELSTENDLVRDILRFAGLRKRRSGLAGKAKGVR